MLVCDQSHQWKCFLQDPFVCPSQVHTLVLEDPHHMIACLQDSNFIQLVKDIEIITLIPPKERTEDQKKKLRNMKSKHKKLEKDFQHLDTLLKQKPKTAAEKKAAYRQKQTAKTR